MAKTPQIFISYSHDDSDFVRRLAQDLKTRNLGVWIDLVEIRVGDSLLKRLEAGITSADYVLAVLSRSSVQSKWVRFELEIAFHRSIADAGSSILPIKIDDSDTPAFLSTVLHADFTNYEKGFEALLQRIYPTERLHEQAEQFVQDMKRRGHTIPPFFVPNAVGSIDRRLVPMGDVNYSVLFWCGMEYWFEWSAEQQMTRLSKWDHFVVLSEFALGRWDTSEDGAFAMRHRFLSQDFLGKFDWNLLRRERVNVVNHALLLGGVEDDMVELAHQQVIDFCVAVEACLALGILRDELVSRIPSDLAKKKFGSWEAMLSGRLLPQTVVRMIVELSRDCAQQLRKFLAGPRHLIPDHLWPVQRQRASRFREYVGANLVKLLRYQGEVDFRRLDFSHQNLAESNFSTCDLSGSVFRSSDLSSANFTGAQLNQVDARGANVRLW